VIVDDVVLRPYLSPDDDPALQAVRDAVRRVEDDVRLPRADDPLSLVAEVGGTVVGFSRVDWWDEADGIRLYMLSGCVHPAYRRHGIGRALLHRQEELATGHWRDHPGTGSAVLGANVGETHPQALGLIHAAGYRIRFTLVDLACDPVTAPDGPALPEGLELRTVQPAHHPPIHAALTTAFAGSGNGQRGYDYAEYLDDAQDTSLWLVAWDGDKIAGVLINERLADGSVDTPWVAVLPAWRRRGLASALLGLSLRRLSEEGIREARIRTVQENTYDTLSLYQRAGYHVVSRQPRYGKPMPD
jgi:ribosomal protein S18 acetylase RimI-like enzyme